MQYLGEIPPHQVWPIDSRLCAYFPAASISKATGAPSGVARSASFITRINSALYGSYHRMHVTNAHVTRFVCTTPGTKVCQCSIPIQCVNLHYENRWTHTLSGVRFRLHQHKSHNALCWQTTFDKLSSAEIVKCDISRYLGTISGQPPMQGQHTSPTLRMQRALRDNTCALPPATADFRGSPPIRDCHVETGHSDTSTESCATFAPPALVPLLPPSKEKVKSGEDIVGMNDMWMKPADQFSPITCRTD